MNGLPKTFTYYTDQILGGLECGQTTTLQRLFSSQYWVL